MDNESVKIAQAALVHRFNRFCNAQSMISMSFEEKRYNDVGNMRREIMSRYRNTAL